jgi:parvulin-like peptidyl-prolyl isomerase
VPLPSVLQFSEKGFKMNSQTRIFALILGVALAATAQVASHAPTVTTASVPAIAAVPSGRPIVRVNGTVLTDRDLAREMLNVFPYAKQHGGKFPKDSEAQIRKQAIHNLEFEELAYQDAKRRGLTVAPAKLDKAVKDFRAQFDDEAQFRQYLKVEQNNSGQELRSKIRRAILIDEAIKAAVDTRARFTSAQLKAFYDKNPERFRKPESISLQTITIAYGDNPAVADKQKARQRAEEALKQARATKDYEGFGQLAEKVSMDDWRVMMGDHKWLHRGRMPEALEKIVFTMKADQVSDIIDAGDSFCIARVNGREDSHLVSFAEVKARLRQDLEKQKKDELRAAFDQRLRTTAKIEEL